MDIDLVLANPPYSCGGDIMFDGCHRNFPKAKYAILMPLAQYKKGDRAQWVNRDELDTVGGEGFDAEITKNNCIVTLLDKPNVEQSYKDLEMASYDPKFRAFYEVNIELPSPWVKYSHAGGRKEDELLDNTTLVLNRRTAGDGVVLKKTEYSDWNDGLLSDSSVFIESTRPRQWRADIFWMKSNKSRNNVWTWYRAKGKDSLAHKVVLGMNKVDGSVEDAFPKIDWEAISDHPLWKEGDYDEAVLDIMGLKWNEAHDGVGRK
jgi:hypothetical protein